MFVFVFSFICKMNSHFEASILFCFIPSAFLCARVCVVLLVSGGREGIYSGGSIVFEGDILGRVRHLVIALRVSRKWTLSTTGRELRGGKRGAGILKVMFFYF